MSNKKTQEKKLDSTSLEASPDSISDCDLESVNGGFLDANVKVTFEPGSVTSNGNDLHLKN